MQTSPEVKNHAVTAGVLTLGFISGIFGGVTSLVELFATQRVLEYYQETLQQLIDSSVNGTVVLSEHALQDMLNNVTTAKTLGTLVNSFEVGTTSIGLGLIGYGVFRWMRSGPTVRSNEEELSLITSATV